VDNVDTILAGTHFTGIRLEDGCEVPPYGNSPSDQGLFRELAERLPQMIWVADPGGKKLYCNHRYLEYMGVKDWSNLDEGWRVFVHPDDRETATQTWLASVASGDPYVCEYRLRRNDGVYRHVLARAFPVVDGLGDVQRWLGCSTDIHEQKMAAERLLRLEKLATAGRLAATLAHQINNPLGCVTNTIYLALQDKSLSADTRAYLKIAERELMRVAHVTKRTLGFHKQSSRPIAADLSETMDAVLELSTYRIANSGIVLTREYQETRPLYGNQDDLRQVIAILIANALDAMESGGRLRIRIREGQSWHSRPVQGIRISVADTGCGIARGHQAHIFEPFFSTKGDTGSGLGLWIAKEIISSHDGKLCIRTSTEGASHGTALMIFLPFENITEASRGE
jgi:PAS domain S-box-containing protein